MDPVKHGPILLGFQYMDEGAQNSCINCCVETHKCYWSTAQQAGLIKSETEQNLGDHF